MIKKLFFLAFIFSAIACNQKPSSQSPNTFAPKVVEAHGYVLPQDSMGIPQVVLVNESTLKKIPAGKPTVVLTNTNIHIAIATNIHLAGTPRVCTPGTDTFLLPKKVPATDSAFVAGIPEITLAKDPHIKDNNPQSFSSFGKLQGLKHNTITCMLQDKSGNIWFGTSGGGVSKYDGKSFTHFTEKEGLSNNTVRSMLEDKSGNLWFGTNGGGVSKYDGKSFTHFTEKEGLSNNTVWSMIEDKSGNLWFGTDGGGVSKYDGLSFTHFTEKEGLSNNIVWSMIEDKSGNLWFGTNGGGVSKYDGKSFTHFTEKEGLSNNAVFSMLEDKSGNLWFGTNGGVWKYDGNRVEAIEAALQRGETITEGTQQDLKREKGKLVKSFTHFTENEGLSKNIVFSILEDKSGNIWFGMDGGGVNKYDGKSFTHFTEKEGLSNNSVRSMLEDKSGNLWFGTYVGGVNKYDGKSFTHFTEKEGLSNNIVLSMLEDKSGNLWIGSIDGGVSKYDGKSFTHFTEKEGLSSNNVFSMLEDKNGNLWFGTVGGGVSKYDGNRVEAIEAALQRGETIPEGTQKDLKRVNGKLVKSFTHFTEKEGLCNNGVLSILEDKSGNLWFGSSWGGVSKYDGKSFTCFTEKEGLSNNTVRSMLEDKIGNLWFGTYGGGVSKYDGNRVEAIEAALKRGKPIPEGTQQDLKRENGKLVKSFTHFTEKEGLSNNIVYSILEDKSGNIWFSTDSGVNMYDGKTFTHYTEKEGLGSNAVLSMLEDKRGNLWFGTRFGLSKLSPENKEALFFFSQNGNASIGAEEKNFFKNYTYEDGFYGNGSNGGKTILEDKKGTIWIAANNRLTAFHPEGDRPDTVAPNIQLTGIELFNENIPWVNLEKKKDSTLTLGNGVNVGYFEFDGLTKWYSLPQHLSLAYTNNYLTFNFIGITQKQNKKVKYKYKLVGSDENWSAISNRTQATYGNLPPYTYTFQVKAMNSEGYWSNELNYTFTIRPPWWKTWWFSSLLVLFVIASLFIFFRWRNAALIKANEKLEATVEKRTHQLQEEKKETEKQKDLVDEKQKEILDSIHYASRIQQALLTGEAYIKENFKAEHFILFKPKDIVAGDFYWAIQKHNLFYMATCDCTGHGVPGAFMSMLNINFFNENVIKRELKMPNEILNNQRAEIIKALNPNGNENSKEGMDCVLCAYDLQNMKVYFSAAYSQISIVRNGALLEFKGDKMSVGKHDRDQEPFTLNTVELKKGDVIYTFTDGYPDQFGSTNKKLKSKVLKKILLQISNLSMSEQKKYLDNFIKDWKGNMEQTDDILLIGVKIPG